ncbi:FAD-binding oxidoreductase [Tistrella bauzanensis]|uniref:FAD-binding oxidoreductase n=1 Tax=Tistrella arctica TaxID=3133430 RepID=A0ABU9YD35_9PROT
MSPADRPAATARPAPSPDVLERMRAIVGPRGWRDDPAMMAPHLKEWRGLWTGHTPAVVMPGSTDEVAAVVGLAAEAGIAIIPQGGNTGLVGGGVPSEDGTELLVSLARMNRIRDIDPAGGSMIAEAGCILADVQTAAAEAGRLFPLSLASEGSARIGGLISTNAGGVHVLRYGSMRDLVLGLEVVLPDGRIWNGLRRLRKDNTGYALRHLFAGAEGTLGIITAAALTLAPMPRHRAAAFVALPSADAALDLFARARDHAGDLLEAFELINATPLGFALRHLPGMMHPLPSAEGPWFVLIELAGPIPLDDLLEGLLAEALEAGMVEDAALARSEAQRHGFWSLREGLSEAQKHEGASIKHDVSVPVSDVPALITRGTALVLSIVPGARLCPFGHMGDGNIHFNVSRPLDMSDQDFLARWDEIAHAVHDLVAELGGSFSAEHGVGRLKTADLRRYRSAVEVGLMERLKRVIDPAGIMSPGRVLDRS